MLGDFMERFRIRAMRQLQGWASEERVLRGIRVTLVNTRPDIDSEKVFQRLGAALELVERYRPDTFSDISRDFSRIHVERFACRGAFFPESRICLTELTFTVNRDFTEAQIAASIVHEGMHARIHAMSQSDPTLRPDEERACRQAELEFGMAIPAGEAIIRRALDSLSLGDDDVAPAIDWGEARKAVADVDARAAGHRDPNGNELP